MESDSQGIKKAMVNIGTGFLSHLNSRDIKFAGISGSVSYQPNPRDDVDIFIISKSGRMWESIFRLLLRRRLTGMSDICLSLVMDESFASEYFAALSDKMIARDSVMVIPVIGEDYFLDLLNSSPFISSQFPGMFSGRKKIDLVPSRKTSLRNIIFFLLTAPLILLKAIVNNKIEQRSGGGFDIHIKLDSFYFDSLKYKRMREEFNAEGNRDELLHSDIQL